MRDGLILLASAGREAGKPCESCLSHAVNV